MFILNRIFRKGHWAASINWERKGSELILPKDLKKEIASTNWPQRYAQHIFITSSGSTQSESTRILVLNKQSFLISAKSVCDHLKCRPSDIWLNPLSSYHVGGLSIYARSFVSGFSIVDISYKSWNPQNFHQDLLKSKATLCSLVPTQVFDLVAKNISSPPTLRAVLVGGGVLTEEIYSKARFLGWPLLPTYGLTECSSQVATASLNTLDPEYNIQKLPDLIPLKHVTLSLNLESVLCIQSASLYEVELLKCNGIFKSTTLSQPYCTGDQVHLQEGSLKIYGRMDGQRKVKGHLVNVGDLREKLQGILLKEHLLNKNFEILFLDHPRLGSEINLVTTSLKDGKRVASTFNGQSKDFEEIKKIVVIDDIPRTKLHKPQLHSIREKIS